MKTKRTAPLDDETGGVCDEVTRRPPARARRLVADPPPIAEFRDAPAIGLGRYLRAARLNRGWSYDELSRRAELDRVIVIALELGLYATGQIRRPWLARLAGALGEEVDDLALLLGIPLPLNPGPKTHPIPFSYLLAETDLPLAGQTSQTEPSPYLGAGLVISRDRYRSARRPRDLDRQFFDK